MNRMPSEGGVRSCGRVAKELRKSCEGVAKESAKELAKEFAKDCEGLPSCEGLGEQTAKVIFILLRLLC